MSGRKDNANATPASEHELHALLGEVSTLLGPRLGDARLDSDRGLLVTVIDLNDTDVAGISRVARRLGAEDRIHVERADLAALATWERLRQDLLRLAREQPRLLSRSATPEPGYRRPPIEIHLSAEAETKAEELHREYGDFVALRVGALPYPPAEGRSEMAAPFPDRPTVGPTEFRITLDGPLVLRSGQTATHSVIVANVGEQAVGVRTNGHLTATIVDSRGAAVGGYAGGQTMALMIFTVDPSESVRIPILVGTASYSQELGYTIPAGVWRLIAPLNLDDGRHLITPALEFTVSE